MAARKESRMKSLLTACVSILALVLPAGAQVPSGGLVDVYIVKVKPEKRADFDAIGKKLVDANQKYKGDSWIAYSVEYGDQNTVMFSSIRDNYAAIDKGSQVFMDAMKEGYGPNFMKIFQDMNTCTMSSRAEVRRRRMDLSWNVPSDTADLEKSVGQSRWLRTLTVRVRQGHGPAYEESVKGVKAGFEKSPTRATVLTSQSAAGQPGSVYYFSSFLKSLGDLDAQMGGPTLPELMGADAFAKLQKSGADDVLTSEWTISRILPELSNPPEGIANADPAFWHPAPKSPAAKPAKAKTPAGD
jgi:hypothetical protein